MIARIVTFIFCLAFAFSSPVYAWNATGHMLVSKIAYNDLLPEVKTEVDRLMTIFSTLYPNADNFVTASVWADDIRARDVDAFSHYHYITLPIYATPDFPLVETDEHNITWAIKEAEKVLKSSKTNDVERAIALSFYLHFMGDIHQPLHCASVFSEQFPNGDKGGNGFLLNSKQYQNLHQLWDSAGGLFPTIGRPLTAYGEAKLTTLMNEVLAMARPPHPEADLSMLSVAKEGNNLSKSVVYADITQNSAPSDAYLARAKQTSADQVVVAGKRVADKLNCIIAKSCAKAA